MILTPSKPVGRRSPLVTPVIITGTVTGLLLTSVMLGSLFAANRTNMFYSEVGLRDLICSSLFGVVMAVPVLLFIRSPQKMFRAGIFGWVIFVLAYSCTGIYYTNLVIRLNATTFHMLLLGAAVYGVLAVSVWVIITALTLFRPEPVTRPSPVRISHRPQ